MMEWGSNCETTQVSQIINSEAVFRFMPRIIKIFQTGAKCYLQDHPIPYFSWFNSHALDVSVADSPGPNKSHPYPSVIPDLVAGCAALSSEIRRFLQAMRGWWTYRSPSPPGCASGPNSSCHGNGWWVWCTAHSRCKYWVHKPSVQEPKPPI